MRRVTMLGVVLPALVGLIAVTRGLFAGEAPVMRDFLLFELPLKAAIAEALHAGRVADWWQWDGLGVPLSASPNASFFHPSTLLLLLPFRLGFVLQLFWNALVGGWGCYRLARSLGTSRSFCGVAVVAWVLNGWGLSLMEQTAFGLGASALPWAWWAALQLGGQRRWAAPVLVIAVASTVLAGDLVMLYAAALPTPFLAWNHRRRWWSLLPVGFALALAALVAAVQLLPTRALLAESPRRLALGLKGADHWNLGWQHLLKLVAPTPAIDSVREIYFSSVYLGAPLLLLALIALVGRVPRRHTWLSIGAVSLMLALGSSLPVWAAMAAIAPGWKGQQYPVKAIGPFLAVISVLAGLGAQRLAGLARRRHRAVVPIALVGATFAAIGSAVGGIAVVGAIAWMWRSRSRWAVASVAPMVATLIAFDLTATHWELVPTAAWSTLSDAPLAKVLRDGGVGPTGYYFGQTWETSHQDQRWQAEFAQRYRRALYPMSNSFESVPTSNAYFPAFSMRYHELIASHQVVWLSRLAGVFATRFFIVRPDQLEPDQAARVRLHDPVASASAYELRQALPRAYLSSGITVLPEAEVVRYLVGEAFRPGREVVLPLDGPFAADAAFARHSEDLATPVESLKRTGADVEVIATLAKPGVLVLNESIFEGVKATDNGEPTPVFAANHVVRGVILGPGRHVVRFTYEAPGLRLGAILSAFGLVLLAIWEHHRQKRA